MPKREGMQILNFLKLLEASPNTIPSRAELEAKIDEFLQENTRYASVADLYRRYRDIMDAMEERLVGYFRQALGFTGASLKDLAARAEYWFDVPEPDLPVGFMKQVSNFLNVKIISYHSLDKDVCSISLPGIPNDRQSMSCSNPLPGIPGMIKITTLSSHFRLEKRISFYFRRENRPEAPEPGVPQDIVISDSKGLMRYKLYLTDEVRAELERAYMEKTIEPIEVERYERELTEVAGRHTLDLRDAERCINGIVSILYAWPGGYAGKPDLPGRWYIQKKPWGAARLTACNFVEEDDCSEVVLHSVCYPAFIKYNCIGRPEKYRYYLHGLLMNEQEWREVRKQKVKNLQ